MSPTSDHPLVDAIPVHATSTARSQAIDRARTFLTIVVLIHHAVIPYTYFGHTDRKFWIGFDAIVLANDSYFMALFFFLSGLFVWPSMMHRNQRGKFTQDRALRLVLPFVLCAFTIIPLAYYAVQPAEAARGFGIFWWQTITIGPWQSGPIWFTWVLFVFGFLAGAMYWTVPHAIDPINRLSQRAFSRPVVFYSVLTGVTALVYIPPVLHFGPSDWIGVGPFTVQSSRILLYAAYFVFGIGVGAAQIDRGVLGPDSILPTHWLRWSLIALIPYAAMWALIYVKRSLLGNPLLQPDWYDLLYALAYVAFSAAMLLAVLAIFMRFERTGRSLLDPLQHDAYGIFLVHYVYVLWIQYWLSDAPLPAIGKAIVALLGTFVLSWATSAALRQIPGARRVL